jgi:rfaE bifunctional protein kinase chain/domain
MPDDSKTRTFDELVGIAAALREAGRKIVHCHGHFDSLDLPAIRLLAEARRQGDVLLVTIVPPHAPDGSLHAQLADAESRAEAVAALGVVDYVAVADRASVVECIELLKPHVYVPPDEANPASAFELEETVLAAGGGVLLRIRVPGPRRRGAAHGGFPSFPPHVGEFLSHLRDEYPAEVVLEHLNSLRGTRVLLVGETIIDEYHYCETLGKSGKEPILAVRHNSVEKFAGGILATANQVADYVDHVGVVSLLGTKDSHETFIRERLNPKVDAMFLYQPGSPTTVKQRFVEMYPFQKLFEVYVMDDEIDAAVSTAMRSRLQNSLPQYDVVIVTDYGHGVMSPEVVDLLCGQAKFLAVNVQTNAANQGFNTVSKYRRADYLCISEKELRLEARTRTKDLRMIVAQTAERLACQRVLVTRGDQGCLCYRKGEGFCTVPAFTQRIVDRVGAGDAVLAVTSPCAAANMPMELIGFVGNAVGSLAVETVGLRNIVAKSTLVDRIGSLLDGESAGERYGEHAPLHVSR